MVLQKGDDLVGKGGGAWCWVFECVGFWWEVVVVVVEIWCGAGGDFCLLFFPVRCDEEDG